MANDNLSQAKNAKKDEFYTSLTDIEKELKYYKKFFKDKVVYCNTDNGKESKFFNYFSRKFEVLGLKQLIATSYNADGHGKKYVYNGDTNGNLIVDDFEIEESELVGNGDFRSEECVAILKQCDVVVTNPPFSLFREFVAQLIAHNKKFLILGNVNAITYKEIFPLFKDNKLWLGVSIHSGDREFRVPDDYPLEAAGCRIDKSGTKYIRVKGVRWFTNIDNKNRHEELELYKRYTRDEYPMFDNYDAINVNETASIPEDYFGIMGVPITFIDFYCPEQFEILGITDRQDTFGYRTKKYTKEDTPKYNDLNARGAIRVNGELKSLYARILIRRIKEQ